LTSAPNSTPPRDDLLLIGKITVPFGVRGQVKLFAITSYPEHLKRLKTVFVGEKFTPYELQRAAIHKGAVMIVTLGGVTTREAAEELRGQEVFMRESEALPLDADEYYLHDLPGLRVRTADGTEIGVVKEVLETGSNEVLVVKRTEGGEALIPMIKDVVQQLDIAAGEIVIQPLPGMLE
jgi:16S rRNA processing protein RimM